MSSAMPRTRRRSSRSGNSGASSAAAGDSKSLAGTQDGIITYTPSGTLLLAASMYSTPASPRTLAISCGSITTDVVPRGRTARANSSTFSFELSMWQWPSMKPGRTILPETSWMSCPSYAPSPTTRPSTIATSASNTSPVKTDRTLPPFRTRSAASSPRATASMRLRTAAPFAAHSKRHDRLGRVQPVFCFVINDRLWTVDHVVRDLIPPVGRQTVHVDGVRPGKGHPAGIRNPVLVPAGDGQRLVGLPKQLLDAPALWVDDVRSFKGAVHVVDHLKRAAGEARVVLRVAENGLHQGVLRRVSERDIHPEAGHQRN